MIRKGRTDRIGKIAKKVSDDKTTKNCSPCKNIVQEAFENLYYNDLNKSQFVDMFPYSGKGNKIFPVTGKIRKNIDNMFPVSEKDDKMFPDSDKGKKKPLKSDFVSLD